MTLPLSPDERARGRRLAIASHPAGMTFYMVFTTQLPTLALVHLGASETSVGLQNGFMYAFQLLQLPVLRAVGRYSKRNLLIAGQCFAMAGALPLLFFGRLETNDSAVPLALLCFALVAVGLNVSQTVWFPLLRGYVEADRIGRFFGALRSFWHLALIVYYLGAQRWLVGHPGAFGELFFFGWLCGVVRIAVVRRLPERSERTGERIRAREALALLRSDRELRAYLIGVTGSHAVRICITPFAIVMMVREVGFSEGDVIATTVAWYAGGLASLYLWGRLVDRVGPEPIFRWTSIGMGVLVLGLILVETPGTRALIGMIGFFFGISALQAGFGVANTHVLFGLAPPDAPARMIVVAQVTEYGVASAAPIAVGFALERWLEGSVAPLAIYHGFFAVAAVLVALAFLPLRRFRS
jgi:Na+/melibiose symporter-like transporter